MNERAMEHKERPPWRTYLDEASARNAGALGTFAQLATIAAGTVGNELRPSVRTVTPRGFLDDGRLQIAIDLRSEKVADIQAHALCELCWYFGQTREQFRFSARGQLIQDAGGGEAPASPLAQSWQARSAAFKQSLSWPQPRGNRAQSAAFELPAPTAAPAHFAILALDIYQLDYLNLLATPHARILFSRLGGQWLTRAVNP